MEPFDFGAHQPSAPTTPVVIEHLRQVAKDDGLPRSTVRDCHLSHCILSNKHLKEVSFSGGSVVHCHFDSCKLTDAAFNRVDLTGTLFIRCDLKNATFSQCRMWYVRFERCALDYEAVLESAPIETNLRLEFLQVLRVNAEQMGERTWVDRILELELRTQERELLNIAIGRTNYYRMKYAALARLRATQRLCLLVLHRLWWGYGLRLSNLMLSGTLLVSLFAALSHWLPVHFITSGGVSIGRLKWSDAFYLSVVAFANGDLGDTRPANALARILTASEGLLGVLFLGFFAAAMYRRLAK